LSSGGPRKALPPRDQSVRRRGYNDPLWELQCGIPRGSGLLAEAEHQLSIEPKVHRPFLVWRLWIGANSFGTQRQRSALHSS